jgi:hypothetical protein
MDSHAPTDIANALMEAQFDEVIEAAAEVIEAPAEGIEAPAAEVIKAPAASTIEAPAQGTVDTKGTANSTKVPTITNTQPEPPIRIPLIRKVIPEVSTYIILNGKTFNRPCQANLYGNNPKLAPSAFVMPTFEQDCFRGQLSISWIGTCAFDLPGTKPSEKINARSIPGHTLKIDISSLDIEDFTIINASKYEGTLPEAFGYQTADPNGTNYFDITNKAYIIFYTKKLNATGTEILYIDTCGCEGYLKSLSKEILSAKQQKEPIFKFFLVIDNTDYRMKMFGKLKYKILADKRLDPLKAWVKNSPNKQLLIIGNILHSREFPPVTKEGWVIANKLT